MNTTSKQLEALLEEELTWYEDLISSACEMGEAIKARELEKVQALTARYDTCVAGIEEREEKRLVICDTISRELGFAQRHTNLSSIIEALPRENQDNLVEIRQKLKNKIADLTKINTSNGVLLKESLHVINSSFTAFSADPDKYRGYRQNGAHTQEKPSMSLVNTLV